MLNIQEIRKIQMVWLWKEAVLWPRIQKERNAEILDVQDIVIVVEPSMRMLIYFLDYELSYTITLVSSSMEPVERKESLSG